MYRGGDNNLIPDAIYSSAMGNNNYNFIQNNSFNSLSDMFPKDENGLMLRGSREEMESGSGSEQAEDKSVNDEPDSSDRAPTNRKRYHRHTAQQIREMESLFRDCPHPDDKQRLKLSQELGLKPRQVKFWFQNRRTQMKAQHDRADNIVLRAENDSLKNENYRLQSELRSLVCPNCGGQAVPGAIPFEDMRLENARLREQLEGALSFISRNSGRPMQAIMGPDPPLLQPSLDLDFNMFPRQFTDPLANHILPMPMLPEASPYTERGTVFMEEELAMAKELSLSSMDELVRMCRTNEPLWTLNEETRRETFNFDEYAKMSQFPLNFKQHSAEMKSEATRGAAVVIMNSINLVDAFLDANKWMELFPSLVARAKIVHVIATGVSSPSGTLLLMFAGLQVLSPLVPSREAYFLRYCQQIPQEGCWAIVDFPVDSCFHHNKFQPSYPMYRRKPSGCLIQDMPNGYSQVTWVEHAEVEQKPVHQIFSEYVSSGIAFGAQRWLAVLERQCKRVASLMAENIPEVGAIKSAEIRKNLMRLSKRMITTFSGNISSCNGQQWTAISQDAEDTVRIAQRKVIDGSGQPSGLILCAVSTTWLPFSHSLVFDLLRDVHRRAQLDILSNGHSLEEVGHIANGSHPGNCISLLRINVASNSSQHMELLLQESCTHESGSLIIYSTVNVESINTIMSGGDPSSIPILPLGFVIIPMNKKPGSTINFNENCSNNYSSGCLLTVGIQALASTIPSAKLDIGNVQAINSHLSSTVHQITAALNSSCTIYNKTQTFGLDQPPTAASEQ
ncbi:homeobox-leucine zipper protein HDG5 [Euphorbia lathyris]|uniref:homeobox-leucine zipper protein HDG5 n=1 Tax=Euphorbia lathyris TaxID=212925 RepID=UPI003313E3DE